MFFLLQTIAMKNILFQLINGHVGCIVHMQVVMDVSDVVGNGEEVTQIMADHNDGTFFL